MKKHLHQPKLSTIRLVEQKLKKKKYFRSRNQLFLSLGKSVMFPTITTILDYLEIIWRNQIRLPLRKIVQLFGLSQIPER